MSTIQAMILANIEANAPMSTAEIVQLTVSEYRKSKFYKNIEAANRYYANEGDINKRVRLTMGAEETRKEVDRFLSNFKIPHGFYRKLTDQKTGFLLGKPFDIQVEDSEEYQQQLSRLFTFRFKRDLKRTGKDAIAGRGWIHIYIDEKGKLGFKRIDPLNGIPIWADEEQQELGAFIYTYPIYEYQGRTEYKIERFELWTTEGVEYFEIDPRKSALMQPMLAEDGLPMRRDHFQLITGSPEAAEPKTEGQNWVKVPFVAFRYNPDEMPLLSSIKDLIDDYDRKMADISNQIEDIPNAILVIAKYSGTDPRELREYIRKHRMIFTEEGGGVSSLNQMLDIADTLVYLEQLRRNIFDFGRGVDTQAERFATASSGIALKMLFEDLNSDASDLETEFQLGMEELLFFVHAYLNPQVDQEEAPAVKIIFNRDMPINESEIIQDAKNSVNIISDETIVANHPWTTDYMQEWKRLEEQREKATQQSIEGNFPFGGEPDNGDDSAEQ